MLEYSIIWIILTGAVFGVTFLSPREFPLYVWLLGSAGAAVFLVGFTWLRGVVNTSNSCATCTVCGEVRAADAVRVLEEQSVEGADRCSSCRHKL